MDALPVGEPLYDSDQTVPTTVGAVETQVASDYPICVLWVPDPEQVNGWREFYVRRSVIKPGAKKMGYKK